jgi:hypothetical protein
MSCTSLINAFPRISGRLGQHVDLNVQFLNSGVPTEPYDITKIEIYRSEVLVSNKVATIDISSRDSTEYPAPLCPSTEVAGEFHYPFLIPNDFTAPDVYFDVWYYNPTDGGFNPTGGGTNPTDGEINPNIMSYLSCCHRFWVFPDGWFCNDKLQTVRFGFEPIDQQFYQPELRTLEVGLMPLPLYDYNFNLVNPIMPFLNPTITIQTQFCETLVDKAPCRIGIRNGSYRSNPYVIQYDVDTSAFLKGTYQYQITLYLPDGTTRVSRKFIIVIN